MIKAPNWAPNAVPTLKGWMDPNTGELLACRRFKQEEIREFYGYEEQETTVTPELSTPREPAPQPELKTESLEERYPTKDSLAEYAMRVHGVFIDKRKSYENMMESLKEQIQ